MSRASLAVLALLATLGAAPPAFAAPPESEAQRALVLFEQSAVDYREGRFQDAVDKLLAARQLKREAVLLYNLARAYEALGHWDEAARAYERYLAEEPAPRDRSVIEARVRFLDDHVAALAARAQTRTPEPATAPPSSQRPSNTAAPWFMAGGGIVLAGAGLGLGLVANGKHDAAVDEPAQQRAADLQDSAESFATVATVVTLAGAALVIAGATWGIVRARRASRAQSANWRALTVWTFQ